jgi:hypothetical protein
LYLIKRGGGTGPAMPQQPVNYIDPVLIPAGVSLDDKKNVTILKAFFLKKVFLFLGLIKMTE